MEMELGINEGRSTSVGVVRLVVELGYDVSVEVEKVATGFSSVKLAELEVVTIPPELNGVTGKLARLGVVTMPPELDGVRGTTSSTRLDVRKQTSQCISIDSTVDCPSQADVPLSSTALPGATSLNKARTNGINERRAMIGNVGKECGRSYDLPQSGAT